MTMTTTLCMRVYYTLCKTGKKYDYYIYLALYRLIGPKYILTKEKNKNKLPLKKTDDDRQRWHMTQNGCTQHGCFQLMPWAKSAKGSGKLKILGNKRLYTWAKRTEIHFRRRKKKIENTNWVCTKGNKIYFSV